MLAASGRSNVPPFMVMDVMAAAAAIEATGGHVIHMEVGQPSASAPKTALAAAKAALEGGRMLQQGARWLMRIGQERATSLLTRAADRFQV